ncbi:uncharacterized protein Z520_05578 [Fonsecaea multimorphosa CBS 102226]|uniref:ubiquitinyl hydrolase 1 n=1 Tax=Fonsecaea multimorphosa CBS 102226 TaxID=1442371 RepID=A0A0D2JXJ3_9EURO|nr:uncharacterized protein Z520_05578 [Fonsecaea multimorphosa CBS 102226]KIX98277.1 hypothetical protein Z520_05578 [Fonsecaea multimorphosa CBS 102226]
MANPNAKLLRAVLNHVILPPDLPDKIDNNLDEINRDLLLRIQDACTELEAATKGKYGQELGLLQSSLDHCLSIHASVYLDTLQLQRAFRRLKAGEILIIHVSEQNAGLLIRHGTSVLKGHVVFEAFEVSAKSEKVLQSLSALQWDFPTSAAAIPDNVFGDESFQQNLAEFLQKASLERVHKFGAIIYKANSPALETRDTNDPALVTGMLTTLLEGIGKLAHTSPIRKRVRDEVRRKESGMPWRRSPFWLLLRVGILRLLEQVTCQPVSNALYKALMCVLHAQLLNQAVGSQTPEVSHLLLRKLGRRIAKLEKDGVLAPTSDTRISEAYNTLLDNLRPFFIKVTTLAKNQLQIVWDDHKTKIKRWVTQLKTRQARPEHMKLSLTNSAPYLEQLRQLPPLRSSAGGAYTMPPTLLHFLRKYSDLAEIEAQILTQNGPIIQASHKTWADISIQLAKQVESYLGKSIDSFEVGTEDRSRMILTTMWLWVLMDNLLCRFMPEFSKSNPVFTPQILDCLRLSSYSDLCRLQQIQTYLAQRHSSDSDTVSSRTILDPPVSGCFADRFYDNLPPDSEMHRLNRSIERTEETRKQNKETEWAEKDARHQQLLREISTAVCQFTFVGDLLIPEHDENKCKKCILTRTAEKIRIERIEKAMPPNRGEGRAVLFELLCPTAFAAYREATWSIVARLALTNVEETKSEPLTMVEGYYSEFYKGRRSHPSKQGLTLASRTKSFLQTHYRFAHFPIPCARVAVNNGLSFEYYDRTRKVWLSEHLPRVTFSHHCMIALPRQSPFARIAIPQPGAIAKYLNADANITSNEILAALPRCPQTLGVPEFLAFQGLICGSRRLWQAILVELGSSNLNFSSEPVMMLAQALICRTGSSQGDTFHVANVVFRDASFCRALLSQIERRLLSISSNPRENFCMETLISLILKLLSLGDKHICEKASELLEAGRNITIQWIRMLRQEFKDNTNDIASSRIPVFILWAALLCRRTFTMFSRGPQGSQTSFPTSRMIDVECMQNTDTPPISSSALTAFLEASIALHENQPVEPEKLRPVLRSILIRDIKMVFRLQSCLEQSLEKFPHSLVIAGVQASVMSGEAVSSRLTSFSFVEDSDGKWACLKLSGNRHLEPQVVQFHLVAGTILLNGRAIEKELPHEIRHSAGMARLFQHQKLVVSPSAFPGMTYKVAYDVDGHEVHLGFRRGVLVVRAWTKGTLLEYIPDSIFTTDAFSDIPASLIENCVHWLNLEENVIEVRKEPRIWRCMPSNWIIDLRTLMAKRRGSILLDPGSNLVNHFANMFKGFEDPRHITVFQPLRGAITVELRRFELSFFVNPNGFLECQQFRAEIDPNQDAGTWYGLTSKIVLRDVENPRRRSVIVPLGPLTAQRRGIHVNVEIRSSDRVYARYFLDEVLGRVTCASEPRLFYTKALLHAYTSFCLPDPLTGKTGTEEACHVLQSGSSQPYGVLSSANRMILDAIAGLAPVRQFYPPDLRVLEQVLWNENLTYGIQHDQYLLLVAEINKKSALLSKFDLDIDVTPDSQDLSRAMDNLSTEESNSHLFQRSQARQGLYQPSHTAAASSERASDLSYDPRGYHNYRQSQEHVFQAARLIYTWPAKIPSPTLLSLMFQNWPSIGGYGDDSVKFEPVRLTDWLDVDLASSWGQLVNFYRMEGRPETKYKLMFQTALVSFREEINMRAVQTLMAFAILGDLKSVDLPSWPLYTQFRPGFRPKIDYLRQLLGPCSRPFSAAQERSHTQKERKAVDATRRQHEARVVKQLDALAEFICDQWPCPQPTFAGFSTDTLDLTTASALITVEWNAMFRNHEFEEHIQQVQDILDKHRSPLLARGESLFKNCPSPSLPREFPLICSHLLKKQGPRMPFQQVLAQNPASYGARSAVSHTDPDIHQLRQIVHQMPTSRSFVRQEYLRGLLDSISALEGYRARPVEVMPSCDMRQLDRFIADAENSVSSQFAMLMQAFQKDEPGALWLQAVGLWPLTTYVSVLETLRSTSSVPLTVSMRAAVVDFGVAITRLQRFLRIQDASRRNKVQLLQDELKNPGHTNWDPNEYPDWVLLEIDTNILIRPIQVEVALATISPASGSNSVLQLNMGQGKTSTIIPLVASVLANGQSLCRVVVPKALLLQTAQLLQLRLGGLLGRELRYVPFSRRTPSSPENIQAYWEIHRTILKKSGVIIALPEHIMSFMLSGQQRLLDEKTVEATQMINVQKWLTRKSRDVFDESDFTMAVKTQLIYPSGPQITVDGGNYRWESIEAVLKMAESHLYALERTHASSIQVVRRATGGFPFVYFLRTDVQTVLIQRIATDICSGRTSLLNVENFSVSDIKAIKEFITEAKPHKNVMGCISGIHSSSQADGYIIYLLRGLLVHRILILTLSRRWNVQYGLHPLRDPVAVPYLAKGIPSHLAEWGHIDVSLLFTCLSFYYQGLSPEQLKQSLEEILKSDDPAREYEQWTQNSTGLSDRLRDWTSINLEDSLQLNEIWCGVRHNIRAIDHFLNNFVFPKHAKQFKVKLQASGWDLPLAGSGTSLTTGFSGTNDNRLCLPLTIKQDDLKGLAHTNAEVLTYLLQDRNLAYSLAGWRDPSQGRAVYRRLTEPDLLRKLSHKKIRILIDSGAIILEMTNATLAKIWLDIDIEATAAVFFDDDNKATVLYRSGRKIPFLASPFADDLSGCLVYLDESHTRGTDMKFPPHARGAVTLSLGQTKDHTVQAVMRLRQLATTQSVTFFAPPEVHQSILDFRGRGEHWHLTSRDVVCWLLEQTCQGLENLQPLYYAQGVNYCRRTQAERDNPLFLTNPAERLAYLNALRSYEQHSLQALYEPRLGKSRRRVRDEKFDDSLAKHIKQLERRRKAFQDTGNAVHASALQEVEQEREVAVEVETVRERQNPLYFHPQTFSGLAEEIRHFVLTGTLRPDHKVCERAFSYMARTETSLKYPASLPSTPQLLVSAEFRRAVIVPSGRPNDDFLRPVQYVLWSMATEVAILVSPEEAEILTDLCQSAPKKMVHLLTYAAPVTQKMLQFNDLNYYAVPPLPLDWSAPSWLKIQIGIFAGRLYFPFEELEQIQAFLGLEDSRLMRSHNRSISEIEELRIDDTGSSDDSQPLAGQQQQTEKDTAEAKQAQAAKREATKMLIFLHAWLGTRSRGQDFTYTPMGYICARKLLTQDHPFFRTVADDVARTKVTHATAEDTSGSPVAALDEEQDNASDLEDEELDERQKLTEEELRQAEEMDSREEEITAEDIEGGNREEAEDGGSELMFGE